jgi:predicted ATP-grasp superfamily ATP-dependent carboligase
MTGRTWHVTVAGVSTRTAAASAARAGVRVTSLDGFADLDQHPDVDVRAVAPFSAAAAAEAARDVSCDTVMYLSSFENHPDAVSRLAAGRRLLGNAPDVLRNVRNPWRLRDAWRRQGLSVPALGEGPGPRVVKPLASGGGLGVSRWMSDGPPPAGHYLQEYVEGYPRSVAFVASPRGVRLLGLFSQLIGDAAFGASGFRYCGNILDAKPVPKALFDDALMLASSATVSFGLVGVNGIDVVERDGRLWPLELNPRWTAAMELVELAFGVNLFTLHATACTSGDLPAFDLSSTTSGRCLGKAVVFAVAAGSVGSTRQWLDDGWIRDVPRAGTSFLSGDPVCTVLAHGESVDACRTALCTRAAEIHARLSGGAPA